MNFKPFWKSKTIVISLITTIFMILDYSLQLGLMEAAGENLNDIFKTSEDGETIKGFNFLAFAAFAYSIAMRFITKKGVSMTKKEAEKKSLDQSKKEIEKQLFEIPENLRPAIIKHMAIRIEEEAKEIRKKIS